MLRMREDISLIIFPHTSLTREVDTDQLTSLNKYSTTSLIAGFECDCFSKLPL